MNHNEPRNAPRWVKAFVAFHVIAITAWSLPLAPMPLRAGKVEPRGSDYIRVFNDEVIRPSPLKFYLLSTGFWQYWDMFSPNPASTDIWGDAEVEYLDGQIVRYQYPRMLLMANGEKYVKERYRKFFERAHDEKNRFLWQPFAERIARLNATMPGNPPVKVRLFRHWMDIAPPGKPQPTEYRSAMYYEARIPARALAH